MTDGQAKRFGGEALFIVGLLLALFTATVIIVSHEDQHADALMDAEAPINIVHGRGNVSYIHPHITPGTQFMDVAPVYTYSLAAWLKAFGVSDRSVISMNCAVVALSGFLVWLFVTRERLVTTPWMRILLAPSLVLTGPVAVIYRTNRYDALGMLGLAAACAALTIRHRAFRHAALAVCGYLVGTGGFHVIVGGGLLSLGPLFVRGRRSLSDFLAFNVGTAIGLGTVVTLLLARGQFRTLLNALAMEGAHVPRGFAWYLLAPVRGGQHSGILDGDLVLLCAAFLAFLGTLVYSRSGWPRSAAAFGLCAGIVIPITLSCFGRYSSTYAWLAAVPMFAGALITLDKQTTPRWLSFCIGGLLLVTTAAGFPAYAFMGLAEWTARDRSVAERFISRHIRDGDVLYTCGSGYYPAKQSRNIAYISSGFHSMTPDQRNSVSLLVLHGGENGYALLEPTTDEALASFGGEWEMVDELLVPRGAFRMILPPRPKSNCTYHLMIYRKQGHASGDR